MSFAGKSRVRVRRAFRRRGTIRRSATFLATAWFAVISLGVPLPAAPLKPGDPFPCQDHSCGCASASVCWNDCCCFTLEEKLAWAKKHGVTPPAGTPLLPVAESKKGSCCGAASAGCCDTEPANCCGEKSADCCSSADHEVEPPRSRYVTWLESQKCQGVAKSWIGTGQPFVPPLPIGWRPDESFAAKLPAAKYEATVRLPRYVGPPG